MAELIDEMHTFLLKVVNYSPQTARGAVYVVYIAVVLHNYNNLIC